MVYVQEIPLPMGVGGGMRVAFVKAVGVVFTAGVPYVVVLGGAGSKNQMLRAVPGGTGLIEGEEYVGSYDAYGTKYHVFARPAD